MRIIILSFALRFGLISVCVYVVY